MSKEEFKPICLQTKEVNIRFKEIMKEYDTYIKRNGINDINNNADLDFNAWSEINKQTKEILTFGKNYNGTFNDKTGQEAVEEYAKYAKVQNTVAKQNLEAANSAFEQINDSCERTRKMFFTFRRLAYGYKDLEPERIKALLLIEIYAENNATLTKGENGTIASISFPNIDDAWDDISGFFDDKSIKEVSKDWFVNRFTFIFASYWESCLELTGSPPSAGWKKIQDYKYFTIMNKILAISLKYKGEYKTIMKCVNWVPWYIGFWKTYSGYADDIQEKINKLLEIAGSLATKEESIRGLKEDQELNSMAEEAAKTAEAANNSQAKNDNKNTDDKLSGQESATPKVVYNTEAKKGTTPSTPNLGGYDSTNALGGISTQLQTNQYQQYQQEQQEAEKIIFNDTLVEDNKKVLMEYINEDKSLDPNLVKMVLSLSNRKTQGFRSLGLPEESYDTSDENMLMNYFKIPKNKVKDFINNPLGLAWYLYKDAPGNETPEDALKYRPRGYLGTVGKAAYQEMGQLLGDPNKFLNNPDLLMWPQYAAEAAIAYAKAKAGVNPNINEKTYDEIMSKMDGIDESKNSNYTYESYGSDSKIYTRTSDGSYQLNENTYTPPNVTKSYPSNNTVGSGVIAYNRDEQSQDEQAESPDEGDTGIQAPDIQVDDLGDDEYYYKPFGLRRWSKKETYPLFSYTGQLVEQGGNRKYCVPLSGRVDSLCGFRNYNRSSNRPHGGVDIAVVVGTKVLSPYDGVITRLRPWNLTVNGKPQPNGGGTYICIYFPEDDITCRLMHLKSWAKDLKEGEEVKRGQLVAISGRSAKTENGGNPHLHMDFSKGKSTGAVADKNFIEPMYVYSLKPGEKLSEENRNRGFIYGRRSLKEVDFTLAKKMYQKPENLDLYVKMDAEKNHPNLVNDSKNNSDYGANGTRTVSATEQQAQKDFEKPPSTTTASTNNGIVTNETVKGVNVPAQQAQGGPDSMTGISDAIKDSFKTDKIESLLSAVVQLLADNNKKLDYLMSKDNIVKMD